jgi:hypothetical protein
MKLSFRLLQLCYNTIVVLETEPKGVLSNQAFCEFFHGIDTILMSTNTCRIIVPLKQQLVINVSIAPSQNLNSAEFHWKIRSYKV